MFAAMLGAPQVPVGILPVVRAVGAVAFSAGAISPGLPAGTVAGDLLIMMLVTNGNDPITAAGWTETPNSPEINGIFTRLTILYKVAVGGDATLTSDSGGNNKGQIVGITEGTFNAANPFNTSANSANVVNGITVPGGTTTKDNCLILAASSGSNNFTSGTWANSKLSEVTKRVDSPNSGCSVYAMTGLKQFAGPYGTSTCPCNTGYRANIMLAIESL